MKKPTLASLLDAMEGILNEALNLFFALKNPCIKRCGILKLHKVILLCCITITKVAKKYIITKRIRYLSTSYLCNMS